MKLFTKKVLTGGGILIIAMMIANVGNLFFSGYLGRFISLQEFSEIAIINTFAYYFSIGYGALTASVIERIAFLNAREGKSAGVSFFRSAFTRAILIAFAGTALFVVSIPFLNSFFHITDTTVFLSVAPMLIIGTLSGLSIGYLKGVFLFSWVALLVILEVGIKIILALVFIQLHLQSLIHVVIMASMLGSASLGLLLLWLLIPKQASERQYRFPKKFFFAAMLTNFSTNAFLTLDMTLVKHFLTPTEAGHYALLALVGKMIFFLGSLLNTFMISFVSRDEGMGKDPNRTFYRLMALITGTVLAATIALGIGGSFVVPILLGSRTASILPYLLEYSVTIALFTISTSFVIYHLARKQYIFSVVSLLMSGLMVLLISLWHRTIADVISDMFYISLANLTIIIGLHMLQKNGGFFVRNVVDFFSLFLPLSKTEPSKVTGKRILVFNWRDIRHSYAGGAEVYIHELAKRWVKKGNKVTVFCGNDGHCPRYEIIDGVEIIRRGGFYFVYIWAFLYYVLRLRGKYDVILDCENGIPFFTPLYVREKIFLVIHHVHQEVFRTNLIPPLSWIASFLELTLMPYVYHKIQIITVSPSTQSAIKKNGLSVKEPVIVYNGVDLDYFVPGTKAHKPLVLYVGRLKSYKSLPVLIHAAQLVVQRIPDAQFVIAGDGEERKKLASLISALGLEKSVQLVGRVNEQEKRDYYQRSWVFCNPSFLEGWGITSIEANACGTPVVASDVPGLCDSVKDNETGFHATYGSASHFAQKIIQLLSNNNKRLRFNQNALHWARRFDWNTSADKSLELIAS